VLETIKLAGRRWTSKSALRRFLAPQRKFVGVLLSGPYQPEADMNEDQVVNGLDVDPFVSAVLGGVQQIPEPSTLLLVLVALGVVGGWRKWKRAV
jgi:hypothetical protein